MESSSGRVTVAFRCVVSIGMGREACDEEGGRWDEGEGVTNVARIRSIDCRKSGGKSDGSGNIESKSSSRSKTINRCLPFALDDIATTADT